MYIIYHNIYIYTYSVIFSINYYFFLRLFLFCECVVAFRVLVLHSWTANSFESVWAWGHQGPGPRRKEFLDGLADMRRPGEAVTMDSPWIHHGFTMLNAGLAHLPKLWTPRSTHHKYVITTLYTPKKCTPRSVNRKQFIKQFTTPSHKLPIRRRNQKNNSPQTPSTKNSNG